MKPYFFKHLEQFFACYIFAASCLLAVFKGEVTKKGFENVTLALQPSVPQVAFVLGDITNIVLQHIYIYDELSDHVESLFGSVPKNLTLHRSKKIFFRSYHLVEEIRSFPTMYNTWGCLWGQIDETKHFIQKSGLKTPILGDTVLDHPTSKRAETHNF